MTRKWLLLKLLEEAGDRGLTTAELLKAGVGSRYSARLLELRELGYGVDGERVRDGMWRYRLVFSPEEAESAYTHAGRAGKEGDPLPPGILGPEAVEQAVSAPSGGGEDRVSSSVRSAAGSLLSSPDTLFDVEHQPLPHWRGEAA